MPYKNFPFYLPHINGLGLQEILEGPSGKDKEGTGTAQQICLEPHPSPRHIFRRQRSAQQDRKKPALLGTSLEISNNFSNFLLRAGKKNLHVYPSLGQNKWSQLNFTT